MRVITDYFALGRRRPPRVYKPDTTLYDPCTGREYPNLLPREAGDASVAAIPQPWLPGAAARRKRDDRVSVSRPLLH